MRIFTAVFIGLLGVCSHAEAQQPVNPKKWEVAGSAALFYAAPGDDTLYDDDWYFEGRYAAAIAHYWTENLKTEARVRDERRRVDLPAGGSDRARQSAELPV